MELTELQELDKLHIQQKTSLTRHRYRVYADNGKGKPGDLVAFVDQDTSGLKEKEVIYTGEDKSVELARFEARQLMDVAAAFDVFTPEGEKIGWFQREVSKSLYRTTWSLTQEGMPPLKVIERSKFTAVARRIWMWLPLVGDFPYPVRYHFDFVRDDAVIGGVDKTGRLADNYLAWSQEPKLDRRLMIAMGVVLDFRQGR
ncbi:hypothetical protein [Actinocrispum sp. NPDC049592]|uniref:hypothetical protein n=1 Tax=Actinocrispum sp. NPDC049592 TaxID=3154835 RepID=UPI003426192C